MIELLPTVQLNSPKTVSFDLDNTLITRVFNKVKGKYEDSLELPTFALGELLQFACDGWKIFIITERSKDTEAVSLIAKLIEKYQIPVTGRIFTGGEPKKKFLEACRTLIHYDDDVKEILNLHDTEITGVLVPQEQ